ncbi:hypothetical protein Dtox_3860 [Desulfofarcimen acetoxidans DSM 771]|uniref:Uncharacterized protein n=1 Tax=Desulfofarcimen acetoxidans (strain ATCC 49208 / DSM 771 / KCTC 5769 / VKM B-1644 / 5575) TaxID=485916 RepID=C8VXG6_DESAS|nr:hypothetical protein Dtox_3860 [Desulfofarcimen acetoxidans DSM 771]
MLMLIFILVILCLVACVYFLRKYKVDKKIVNLIIGFLLLFSTLTFIMVSIKYTTHPIRSTSLVTTGLIRFLCFS